MDTFNNGRAVLLVTASFVPPRGGTKLYYGWGTCSNCLHMFKQLLVMHVLVTRQNILRVGSIKKQSCRCTVPEHLTALGLHMCSAGHFFLAVFLT